MNISTTLSGQLEAIKANAISAIRERCQFSDPGKNLFNSPAYAHNQSVELTAISVEYTPQGSQAVYLIGEDPAGEELHETDLAECEVEDLIWALEQLEKNMFEFEPAIFE
jgi:hypothetical protein